MDPEVKALGCVHTLRVQAHALQPKKQTRKNKTSITR